jgi:hypothetical protein
LWGASVAELVKAPADTDATALASPLAALAVVASEFASELVFTGVLVSSAFDNVTVAVPALLEVRVRLWTSAVVS